MASLAMVRSFEVRKTRNQDNFGSLRINLGAVGGFAEIDAKIWGLDAIIAGGGLPPASGDILELRDYKEDEYQGKPQWILRHFRVLAGTEREQALAGFVPPLRIDRTFYLRRLDELIDATDPARVSGIVLRDFFDSAGFREAFCAAPAALKHHQSYPGGLLEHTLNVTGVALAIADAYGPEGLSHNGQPMVCDRHVLIAAGLLHDIGKLETYRLAPLSETTDAQNWEGHLAIGYAQVRARVEPMLAAPPYPGAVDELRKLLHCILAHHGHLEFGSPVGPACVEAFILSQADMTDARLAEIVEAAGQARSQDGRVRWAGRNQHFPGGVFVGDWPPPAQGG